MSLDTGSNGYLESSSQVAPSRAESMLNLVSEPVPPLSVRDTMFNGEILLEESSDGMNVRPRAFLLELFRPHVFDYQSMDTVIGHLAAFCHHALIQTRLNQDNDRGFTPQQMLRHAQARATVSWPLDDRVNLDFREALHKFDWQALWNAAIEESARIQHYQSDILQHARFTRLGAQRWLIVSAVYADLRDHAFGLHMFRYLEPIATLQAFHYSFQEIHVEQDISGEDVHEFSRAFFRHWNRSFQLLKVRHPVHVQQYACHIFKAFVRQGVNVADVFLKYWYQRGEDWSDDRFGIACELSGRSAVDRLWREEVDRTLALPDTEVIPPGVRIILARAQHGHSRRTLFSTVARLISGTHRDDLQDELFKLMIQSLKDWADLSGNRPIWNQVNAMINETERALGNPGTVSGSNMTLGPLSTRPLSMLPLVLLYGLPEDLVEPPQESDDSNTETPNEDEIDWEEFSLNDPQPTVFQRALIRLFSVGRPEQNLLDLADIPMEAYGPRIRPETVSSSHEAPKDETCAICLENYDEWYTASANSSAPGPSKQGRMARALSIRVPIAKLLSRSKASKNKEGLQPMRLKSCVHCFHLACLDELLNQAYPKRGVVQCPCCRAVICAARPTRPVHSRLRRIPLLRRLARS